MPKLLDAKVGDTVLIKGVVTQSGSLVGINIEGCALIYLGNHRECEQITPKPWEPKVGDIVSRVDYPLWAYKVLFIDLDDVFCRVVRTSPEFQTSAGQTRCLKKADICAD